MAMLAESRSRQKWSDDPRNTRWANDTSKFGYQMLTRMGWSEGKGLGQNLTGQTSHVKVMKRKGNSGIGSKRSHDDDWISHQNDFNDLLSALNQGSNGTEAGIKSLEDRVKSSKKKILYTKFVKSKDLSNASSQDLACIFGTRAKSAPVTPNLSEDEGNNSDASAASCPPVADHIHEHGFTTVNTGVSVADYFAKKMAALKNTQNVVVNSEEQKTSKKKAKKLKSEKSSDDDTSNNEKHDCDDIKEIKKKKKKKRKHDSDEEIETQETEDLKLKKSKKKKRKTLDVDETLTDDIKQVDENIDNELEDTERKSKKKKKKKKKNNVE